MCGGSDDIGVFEGGGEGLSSYEIRDVCYIGDYVGIDFVVYLMYVFIVD